MNPLLNEKLYAKFRERLEAIIHEATESDAFPDISELQGIAATHSAEELHECIDEMLVREQGLSRTLASALGAISFAGTNTAQRAANCLVEDLGSEEGHVRRYATFWLFWADLCPPSAAPDVARVMESAGADEELATWAAGAVYQLRDLPLEHERFVHQAEELLVQAQTGETLGPLLAALVAFGRRGEDCRNIDAQLRQLFEAGDSETKLCVLRCLPKIGVFTCQTESLLRGIVTSDTEPPEVQMLAVQALAKMPLGQPAIDEMLCAVAMGNDFPLARHACLALLYRNDRLPEYVLDQVIAALGSPTSEQRAFAALVITDIPSQASRAIPYLINQLVVEEDDDVICLLIDACGAMGVSAVVPLVEALRTSSLRTAVLFQTALLTIGKTGCGHFARLLTDADPRIRETGVGLLQMLGKDAEEAIPCLAVILDSPDPIHTKNVLMASMRMGPCARTLVPKISEFLFREDEELAWWAEAALVGVGRDCIPHLEQLLKEDPVNREVVERVLARIGTSSHSYSFAAVTGVEGISNRSHLMVFAVVGRLYYRGPRSMNTLELEIDSLKKAGAVPLDLPSSARNIGLVIKGMERALTERRGIKVALVDRSERKAGSQLTPEGKLFLSQVEKHLGYRLELPPLFWLTEPRDKGKDLPSKNHSTRSYAPGRQPQCYHSRIDTD